jgi:hypothetical protein
MSTTDDADDNDLPAVEDDASRIIAAMTAAPRIRQSRRHVMIGAPDTRPMRDIAAH